MSDKEIKVPQLAESITEGTIVKWLVAEGEQVQKDEPIVELETDKVNVEINSDYAGIVKEIVANEGQDVEVGETIARVLEGPATLNEKVTGEEQREEKPTTRSNEQKDNLIAQHSPEENISAQENEQAGENSHISATPSARKYARENGISLDDLDKKLMGAYGTIGRREAELLAIQQKESSVGKSDDKTISSSSNGEEPMLRPDSQERPTERIKMSRRRMTIAKRLVAAQHNAAMLTTFNEVDMTNVMKLRKDRKDKFLEKHGVKLGFMSFFTKAVVAALKNFPLLNAEIEGNELIIKKYYDIGIAVSTEEGLVVPVVRNADQLGFAGIEQTIGDLGKKARDNELEIADLQGGSFTITNGGVFGSLLSTPILNTPQVGILGMHTIQKRPVAMPDDTIEIRPMMYVAVSYDHRIVDGKEAVQFLVRIKQLLEDPYDLLLES